MTREYAEGPEGRVMLPHLHYTVMPVADAEKLLSTRVSMHFGGDTLDADNGSDICDGVYEIVGWGHHATLESMALVEIKEVDYART